MNTVLLFFQIASWNWPRDATANLQEFLCYSSLKFPGNTWDDFHPICRIQSDLTTLSSRDVQSLSLLYFLMSSEHLMNRSQQNEFKTISNSLDLVHSNLKRYFMLTTIISTPFMYSDADMILATFLGKWIWKNISSIFLASFVSWQQYHNVQLGAESTNFEDWEDLEISGRRHTLPRWTPERNRFNDNNRIARVYICQWSVTLRFSTAAMRSLMITKWSFRSFSGPPHSKYYQIPEVGTLCYWCHKETIESVGLQQLHKTDKL